MYLGGRCMSFRLPGSVLAEVLQLWDFWQLGYNILGLGQRGGQPAGQ